MLFTQAEWEKKEQKKKGQWKEKWEE